jgi:MFS family permease
MVMMMIAGGKIGSLIGRKPPFVIGLVIYCAGSWTTAPAPTLVRAARTQVSSCA